MQIKNYYVYIITNRYNTVFYVGMTNNLLRRINEHQRGVYPDSFSKRYNIHKLVYYEETTDVYSAISREKQIKGWMRYKKVDLIMSLNPDLKELVID